MRALVFAWALLGSSFAQAQGVVDPAKFDATLLPRSNALIVGASGGAAEIADEGNWGRVRYGLAGVDLRFERLEGRLRSGATVSSLLGRRTALDEPLFDRFGRVTDRFALTYVGGVLGYATRRFELTTTFGIVAGTFVSSERTSTVLFGVSLRARLGRLERIAGYGQLGSTDSWLSDRTMAGAGIVRDSGRFRFLVGAFIGATMAPPLNASANDPSEARPRFRGPRDVTFIPLTDFGARLELGGWLGATFLGVELSVGQQLPMGRLLIRAELGTTVDRR